MSRYNTLREYTTECENFKVIASGTLLALVETESQYGKSTIKRECPA